MTFAPFHSQEWSISNFSCSLTRNITSRSIKNLAFHSLLRCKMIIIYQFSLPHSHIFSREVWENAYSSNLGVKGFMTSCEDCPWIFCSDRWLIMNRYRRLTPWRWSWWRTSASDCPWSENSSPSSPTSSLSKWKHTIHLTTSRPPHSGEIRGDDWGCV